MIGNQNTDAFSFYLKVLELTRLPQLLPLVVTHFIANTLIQNFLWRIVQASK